LQKYSLSRSIFGAGGPNNFQSRLPAPDFAYQNDIRLFPYQRSHGIGKAETDVRPAFQAHRFAAILQNDHQRL
jgi:hypothetical protein